MKIISKDGRTWMERDALGKTTVGFTRPLLDELGECWHIIPAATLNRVEVKEEQPLCSVETNEGMFCIKSPTKGMISFFNNDAINFPDRLTEDTPVAEITEFIPVVEAPEQPRAERARRFIGADIPAVAAGPERPFPAVVRRADGQLVYDWDNVEPVQPIVRGAV